MAGLGRTLGLLDLNQDVLFEILSWLSASDAFHLALTSRAIEPLALRRALSRIEIRSPKHCLPFLQYVTSDIQRRPRFLQKLALHTLGSFAELHDVRNLLAKLLANARNLKRLSLPASQSLLYDEPCIGQAICALPFLDSLSLLEGGALTLDLFPKLRSKLTEIVHQTTDHPKPDHSVLLASSALSRIKTLRITGFDAATCQSPPMDAWPISPSLHHLELSTAHAPMSAFVRAFPNLRFLSINNIRSPESQPGPSTCWSSLDHVSGEVLSLHYWSVSCPVRVLELSKTKGRASSNEDEIADILRIIRNTSPVVLKLAADTHTTGPELWVPLTRIVPRLTSLEIVLEEWAGPFANVLIGWVNTIPQVLASLRLLCIHIKINIVCMRWCKMQHEDLSEEDCQYVLSAVSQTLPTSLAKHMRSLQHIFIRASQHRPLWDTVQEWRWRVVEDEGNRALEPASLEEEIRVVDRFL